ncbi:unnamed protein product [Ectocarpus sp. 8 AP-2014]
MSIPFNLNYPIERARAHVQTTKIKDAVREVFGDQMNRIENAVSSPNPPNPPNPPDQMSADVKTLLKSTQELTDKLNALIATGSSNAELAEVQEKLRKNLDRLKKCRNERETLRGKNKSLEAQVKDARAEAAAAGAGTPGALRAAKKVVELEKDLKDARELVKAVDSGKAPPSKISSMARPLRTRQNPFVTDILSVHKKLQTAATKSTAHEKHLSGVKNALRTTQDQLQKEKNKVNEKQAEHDAAIKELHETHDTITTKYKDEMDVQIVHINQQADQIEEGHQKILALKEEVKKLEATQVQLNASKFAIEAENKSCQEELEALRKKVHNPSSTRSSSGDDNYGSPSQAGSDTAGPRSDNSGSRSDNAGWPSDNAGPRSDNSGPRSDNSGSRSDTSGSPSDNAGPRYENSEWLSDTSGSRSDNAGPRSDNSGRRLDNAGPRSDNSGPRSDNSGSRSYSTDSSSDNSGLRLDNAGPRSDNSGSRSYRTDSSSNSTGSPVDNTGLRLDNASSPSDNAGPPSDNAGSPVDNAGSPFDHASSPFANPSSPSDNAGSPVDNAGSPFDNPSSPFDNPSSPSNSAGSPSDSSDSSSGRKLDTGVETIRLAMEDKTWEEIFQNAMTRKKKSKGRFTNGPYKKQFQMLSKFSSLQHVKEDHQMFAIGNMITDKIKTTGEPQAQTREERDEYHTDKFESTTARNVMVDNKLVNLTNTEAFHFFRKMRKTIIGKETTLVTSPDENGRLFLLIVGVFGLITPGGNSEGRQVHIAPSWKRKAIVNASFDLSNLFVWF